MDQETAKLIDSLRRSIDNIATGETGVITYLTTPLTNASWDGDGRSTTAKTLLDLSAVFGAPAGIRAVYVTVQVRDSGSAGADTVFILAPNNTANQGMIFSCGGLPNDQLYRGAAWVPCVGGDVYFQCIASGASTLDVDLKIWGYEF